MARIVIPVECLEFDEGGNTLWVQGLSGTVLRVKVKGSFRTEACRTNPVSHLDLEADNQNPTFCLGPDVVDGLEMTRRQNLQAEVDRLQGVELELAELRSNLSRR
jgi:hypothetical protein